MKIVLLLYLLIPQTVRGEARYVCRFPSSGSPFDSIVAQLDSLDFLHQLDEHQSVLVQQLTTIAERQQDSSLKARSLYWYVKSRQYSMNTDSCIVCLEEALRLLGEESAYDRARVAYQLAGNYQRTNRHAEAWQLLHGIARPGFEACGDSAMLGNVWHLFALIYHDISDSEAADEAISRSADYFSGIGYPLSKVYFFQALLSDDEAGCSLYRKAISEDTTEATIVSQAYTNLASQAIQMEQDDSARHFIRCGLRCIDRYQPQNQLLRAFLLVNDALLDNRQGDYRHAIVTLQEVERLCGTNVDLATTAPIYRIISETYEHLGATDSALRYLHLFIQAQDKQHQLLDEAKQQRAMAREDIHAEQIEEMERLRQETIRQRQRLWVSVLLLLFTLGIAVVSISHYVRKRRQREVENKELREVLQQETINALITHTTADPDDRTKAEEQFGQLRPGFFSRLKKICPELTENDLRICLYVSIGMRAKEIAAHLSVTPDSVNTARYRLRKKLNLKSTDKLDDFLRNL